MDQEASVAADEYAASLRLLEIAPVVLEFANTPPVNPRDRMADATPSAPQLATLADLVRRSARKYRGERAHLIH